MSVFKKYLLVNLILLFVHPMLFFTGIMGFGSAPDHTPKIELIKAILSLAFVGACANLLVFIISAFSRKNIKQNLIWALAFFTLVFTVYLGVFWSVLK